MRNGNFENFHLLRSFSIDVFFLDVCIYASRSKNADSHPKLS